VGEVSCNTATGLQEVLWTFDDNAGTTITINSATTTSPALTDSVTLSPNPVTDGNAATGTSEYPGDATGDTHLSVDYTFADQDPTVDGEVVLPGGCEQVATTTTTTAATTTTEPATTTTEATAVAPAVQAQPAFTG
jgi:hypothetical protein